jgi:hypothetical protein
MGKEGSFAFNLSRITGKLSNAILLKVLIPFAFIETLIIFTSDPLLRIDRHRVIKRI